MVWQFLRSHSRLQQFFFYHLRPIYTRLRYYNVFGKTLNLRQPQDFEQKLFWLSVYYRHPLIEQCADKYRVREYINKCGCTDILNTLYGAYDNAQDIPFSSLPNRFVVKSNRGSGDNFFCLDKTSLHTEGAISLFESWREHTYGIDTAEYQYARMPFKLVVERYLKDNENTDWMEYQFFCFNGKPAAILVRNDLETNGKQPFAMSYSLDWQRMYLREGEEQFTASLPHPATLDKMIDYATRLAKPFPHVRVDFYEVNGKLYFGELTFSTHGNVFENYKQSTLEQWNQLLTLPKKYTARDRY